MAIHPNSGVEFNDKDPDGYPVDDGTPKQSANYVDGSTSFEGAGDWPPQASAVGLPIGHQQRGSTGQLFEVTEDGRWKRIQESVSAENDEAEKKRKTVNVHNGAGRSLMLHLHMTIEDDGGSRPFQGRMLSSDSDKMPDAVQLRAGHSAGVDKEFWTKWCEQNKGSDLLPLLTAEDEDDNPESAKREE